MKVLPNGDYELEDGTVIPKDQIGEQYKTAPVSTATKPKDEDTEELAEGQSSGPIPLND